MQRRPNFTLEAYNLARMEQELREASVDLAAVDGLRGPRSYAYTCCEDFVGPDRASYRPMVERLFPAGRGGRVRELADPYAVDLSYVPSWAVVIKDTGADMTSFIDDAIDRGAWAVIQFHGVGGGHNLNVARDAHQAVCRHLAERAGDVWCDTFLRVATHVRAATRRPWKG
jgi:sialate O-acetylesterase